MIVGKGDTVRVLGGDTGEITEVWGAVRTFIRFKRNSDGKSIPMFESEVIEIIECVRLTTMKGVKFHEER